MYPKIIDMTVPPLRNKEKKRKKNEKIKLLSAIKRKKEKKTKKLNYESNGSVKWPYAENRHGL